MRRQGRHALQVVCCSSFVLTPRPQGREARNVRPLNKETNMKTYDLAHLVNREWSVTEQPVAPSRRVAMKRLRDDPNYSATQVRDTGDKDKDGKPIVKVGGKFHGCFRVSEAV